MKQIKAILFDSGMVLAAPITGHWFITPNFWKYADKEIFDGIESKRIDNAFSKSIDYITMQKYMSTKDDEYSHFVRFYEIFSDHLPELHLTHKNIEDIAKDLVFNPDKYKFYNDAFELIPDLSRKYKLAIVSDAWPSLYDVYDKNDMTKYFDSIVISSFTGTTKPDEKMYRTALEELDVEPYEAVFVDDNVKNCIGAVNIGIKAVLICRNKNQYYIEKIKSIGKKYKVINNLHQLENIINS